MAPEIVVVPLAVSHTWAARRARRPDHPAIVAGRSIDVPPAAFSSTCVADVAGVDDIAEDQAHPPFDAEMLPSFTTLPREFAPKPPGAMTFPPGMTMMPF